MSFVFISHANPDKPKIKPFVDALLKAGLAVFIDRPGEMGYDPDEMRGRIFYLPGGAGDYRSGAKGLNAALREAPVVVVFWSTHVLEEHRHVWRSEATYARVSESLVSVRLDNVPLNRLPDEFDREQVIDLATDTTVVSNFKQLVEDVRRKFLEARRRRAAPLPPLDIVPFAADCGAQADAITSSVRAFSDDCPLRRPILALRAEPRDAPEHLINRIVSHEVRCLCELAHPPADKALFLPWPETGRASADTIMGALRKRVRDMGQRCERPHLVVTTVARPSRRDVKVVSSWLAAWDEIMAEFPSARLIPLLVVIDRRSWLPLVRRGDVIEGIVAAVEAFSGTATEGQVLEPMCALSREDAVAWRIECVPADAAIDLQGLADEFIDRRFSRWRRNPRLGDFAGDVRRAPWWPDLRKHYNLSQGSESNG